MDFQTENRLWNGAFIFFNLSFFLFFTNIAFLYLYPLVLEDLGGENDVIGLVMGIFSLSAVISRPFMGKITARKGEYQVLSLGMAISLMASLSYNFITGFGPCMVLIRVIHGLGFSAFIAASFSLAAKIFQPGKRGEAFSIVGGSIMSAVAFAPPIGEILIQKWGFHALYMAASASIILAWFAAYLSFSLLSQPVIGDRKADAIIRYIPLIANRSFLFLLTSTFIFAHCQSTVANFLALIAAEKGIASGRFFFSAYFVAIIVLITMGRLIDRYGKLLFLRLSYPFFALGILLIPGMITTSFFAVAAILYGVGIGLLFPTHNALAASHGSDVEKPAVMSLFTTVYDTGFITGAVVSGWLAHKGGLDSLYWTCGVLGFIGFLIMLIAPSKEKQRSQ